MEMYDVFDETHMVLLLGDGPIKQNINSNKDFIAAVRKLYFTGSSIHESGLTGYNHARGGFFMDPDGPRRDSIAYLGLKRD